MDLICQQIYISYISPSNLSGVLDPLIHSECVELAQYLSIWSVSGSFSFVTFTRILLEREKFHLSSTSYEPWHYASSNTLKDSSTVEIQLSTNKSVFDQAFFLSIHVQASI